MGNLTIGKVAKQADVNIETIRYYQRIKLLETPEKTNGRIRYYHEEFVERIQFIKHAQKLGFTLKEIAELLSYNTDLSPSEMKRKAGFKVMEIDQKIRDFQKLKTFLVDLIDACSGDGSLENCPIYKAINENEIMDTSKN